MSDDDRDDHVWTVHHMDDEFEEISCDEVDRVLASLEVLMASVESENIRHSLELVSQEIFNLVYEAEDEEGPAAQAA